MTARHSSSVGAAVHPGPGTSAKAWTRIIILSGWQGQPRLATSRPDNLKTEHRDLLVRLTGACPERTQLVSSIGNFAQLLTPCAGNAQTLSHWIVQVHAADLPHLHAFTRAWTETATP